jgi:hypothetical protein
MRQLTSTLGHWDLSHLFVIGILALGFLGWELLRTLDLELRTSGDDERR